MSGTVLPFDKDTVKALNELAAEALKEPPNVRPINPAALALLERLVEMARKGEIDSVAVAWTNPLGGSDNEIEMLPLSRPATLAGEILIMQTQFAVGICNVCRGGEDPENGA